MRLSKARVQKYRSIRDTGLFDVERTKTILVGPNEAGKTALLVALQQLNPPEGIRGFDALRDYPRSEYNDITTGKVQPKDVTVVEGHFELEDEEKAKIAKEFSNCTYVVGRRLDNESWHRLEGGPDLPTFGSIRKRLARLAVHADGQASSAEESERPDPTLHEALTVMTADWDEGTQIDEDRAQAIGSRLSTAYPWVDSSNEEAERSYKSIEEITNRATSEKATLNILADRLPVIVRFDNYFRVKPSIHLRHLADRLETNSLDDEYYDYGNSCLLRFLGFSARELSQLGEVAEPAPGDRAAFDLYLSQLDNREHQLNAASVRLTAEINRVWVPDPERDEAAKLLVSADSQYLKVAVEDDLGVKIELDQRSAGFQWLVSFFVVFFAEAMDKHENAILLLDEPGLSLHGLKQREFRSTISRLAEVNQTLYTTHSPFLVGPGELDRVRVLEMTNRTVGTKVYSRVTAKDSAALLPLQEALGYDLAQSLFTLKRNLVLEGLTDYWYVEALAEISQAADIVKLNRRIALIPAKGAGRVVYFATILHAQRLKVAALLDSDAAGDQAAKQDVLVHTLGNNRILRTCDAYDGLVTKPEIEELLRETLVTVAKQELEWDVSASAATHPKKSINRIFKQEIESFSKYKLAKAFLRWARDHEASDLQPIEREQFARLITSINKALT